MNELSKKWELCLEKIKDLLNDQIKYDTFYKSAKILDFNNGIVRIVVEMEFYQKVLNNEMTVDKTHSYEQQKKKNLLLQGYSNEDINILSEFDKSYMDSNIIKSMKVKNDNSFYSYSKVLSNKSMTFSLI